MKCHMTLIVDYLSGKYLLNGFRVLGSDVPTYLCFNKAH